MNEILVTQLEKIKQNIEYADKVSLEIATFQIELLIELIKN